MKSFQYIILTLLVILLCVAVEANATEGDLLWSQNYALELENGGYSIIETEDGGYIFTGSTYDYPNQDLWLVKIDSFGELVWSQRYDVGYKDAAVSIIRSSDDYYLLSGLTTPVYYMDYWLLKVDSAGDTLWTKAYDTGEDDYARDVIETSDSGYLMVGVGDNFNHCANGGNIWVVKTNSDGDSLWSRLYEGNPVSAGESVIETEDGGFLITGDITFDGNNMELLLMKIDSNGDSLWSRTYGEYVCTAKSIIQSQDDCYVIAGLSSESPDEADALLLKVDANGDTIWWKEFGGNDQSEARKAIETDFGDFIMIGSNTPYNEDNRDFYLVKTDRNGNLLWERTYGDSSRETGYSIIQASNGNYMIIGTSWPTSGDTSYAKVLCIEGPPLFTKTEPQIIPMGFSLVSAYPNPFNPSTIISFQLPAASLVKLDVFDIDGWNVRTSLPHFYTPGSHQIPFDGANLPSGIYIYRLTAGELKASGKLVLMK